ncbi:AAEL017322-PA [Aedes aegypti]|uniref:AAEL017322-PA n=1 Tax=Aedes aegypti TaxID=7159 RepID=J9E997_AEDAE|nr:AAEL017322-PA [Aedes aegypti]
MLFCYKIIMYTHQSKKYVSGNFSTILLLGGSMNIPFFLAEIYDSITYT